MRAQSIRKPLLAAFNPDISKRFISLASWSIIAFALEKGVMTLSTLLLARFLGAGDFGQLTLVQGFINSLQVFILLGAGYFVNRYVPEMRKQSIDRAVGLINLYGGLIVASTIIILLFVALNKETVIEFIFNRQKENVLLLPIILWIIASSFNGFLMMVIVAFEKGRLLAATSALSAVLWLSAPPFLTLRLGLEGAIIGVTLVEAARFCALLLVYVLLLKRSGGRFFAKPRRSDVRYLFSFGLPVFLQTAIWAPTIWLAQVIVKTLSPDGFVAVGTFGLGNTVLSVVLLLSGLTNRAALPILSSLRHDSEPAQAKRATWLLAVAQVCVATLLGLPLMIATPLIMTHLGPSFIGAWPVLVIMIATGIILAGQDSLGNYLLVMDRSWFLLATIVPWAAILLGAAAMFPQFGAYSLALGLLAASIVRTSLIFFGWARQAPAVASPGGR